MNKNNILMIISTICFILTIMIVIVTNVKYMFLSGWEILFHHTFEAVVIPGIPLGIAILLSTIAMTNKKGDKKDE